MGETMRSEHEVLAIALPRIREAASVVSLEAPTAETHNAPESAQPSRGPAVDSLATLHRTAGNRAVGTLLRARSSRRIARRSRGAYSLDDAASASPARLLAAAVLSRAAQQDAVFEDLGPVPQPILRLGSQGPSVATLQDDLNTAGIAEPLLAPDGIFGNKTLEAVLGFQRMSRLTADGVVGPLTQEALSQQLGARETGATGSDVVKEGPPLVSGEFPPKTGACTYVFGERERSADSGGQFEQPRAIGPTVESNALMFDFEPGKSATRPNHRFGMSKLIADLRLDTAKPTATVSVLLGHTDCVDSESRNSVIRANRASEASRLFSELGARPENIGDALPATSGSLPGDDATIEGRARNRSVVIKIVELPGPKEQPPPGLPEPDEFICDRNRDFSDLWFIQDAAGGNLVGGVGAVVITFMLVNGRSCCAYPAIYRGIAGGVSAGFELGIPTGPPTDFTTPFNVAPADFSGDAKVFSASFSIFEHATLDFATSTTPEEIDIGGVNFADPFSLGVFGSEGKFFVFSGFALADCPSHPGAFS